MKYIVKIKKGELKKAIECSSFEEAVITAKVAGQLLDINVYRKIPSIEYHRWDKESMYICYQMSYSHKKYYWFDTIRIVSHYLPIGLRGLTRLQIEKLIDSMK